MHQMQRFWHMSMRQLQGVHDSPRKNFDCINSFQIKQHSHCTTNSCTAATYFVPKMTDMSAQWVFKAWQGNFEGSARYFWSFSMIVLSMQGNGVVQPDKLKRAADPVRQAANKVSSMLGGSNSSQYNSHMLRSNRWDSHHHLATQNIHQLQWVVCSWQSSVFHRGVWAFHRGVSVDTQIILCVQQVQWSVLHMQVSEMPWIRAMHLLCMSRSWLQRRQFWVIVQAILMLSRSHVDKLLETSWSFI